MMTDNDFKKIRFYGTFNYRPMVLAALGLGLGILTVKLTTIAIIIIASLFCLLSLVAFSRKNTAIFLFAFFAVFGILRVGMMYPPVYNISDNTYIITGRVANTISDNTVLENVTLNGNHVEGKLLIKATGFSSNIDDIIVFRSKVEQSSTMSGNTYKLYLLSEDYTFIANNVNGAVTIGHMTTVSGFFAKLHNSLSEKCDELFGKNAPMVKGILLGDTSEIPEDTLGALRDTGIAHLFALSGLHVSVITGFLLFVMKKLSSKKRTAIIGIFLLVYCALTAFPASLVRASLMCMMLLASELLYRKYDPLSSASFAFILILLVNPYQLFAAGFQLTFWAVAGIFLTYKPLYNTFSTVLTDKVSASFATSISATSGTMPAVTTFFHRMPIYSFVTNIVAIPIASVAVISAFVGCILGFVFYPLSVPFSFVTNLCFDTIGYIIGAVSQFPFAVVQTQSMTFICGMLYAMRMVAMSPYYIAKGKIKLSVAMLLTVLTFCAFLFL